MLFACPEASIVKMMELPKDLSVRGLKRMRHHTENGSFYTGGAILNIILPSKGAAENVQNQSFNAGTNEPRQWFSFPTTFYIPSLHLCETSIRQGHLKEWCYKDKLRADKTKHRKQCQKEEGAKDQRQQQEFEEETLNFSE